MKPTITKIWIITDTHFNHRKLEEYAGRPSDFETRIMNNLKTMVGNNDLLIHLGDFCIGQDVYWHTEFHKLPGRKVFVMGNHDQKSVNWYLNHGWYFVCHTFSLWYGGKKILFSHIPQEDKGHFDLNVHGHFHNTSHRSQEPEIQKLYNPAKHKLLAIENTEYKPVLLDSFL